MNICCLQDLWHTSRVPVIGDIVRRVDGDVTVGKATSSGQWSIKVGEVAVVVQVNGRGWFRLKDAHGFETSSYQKPEDYCYVQEMVRFRKQEHACDEMNSRDITDAERQKWNQQCENILDDIKKYPQYHRRLGVDFGGDIDSVIPVIPDQNWSPEFDPPTVRCVLNYQKSNNVQYTSD